MNPLVRIFMHDAFWEGLLAAFIVDVIVVLAVLGPALKYFEKKAWDGTRQGLSYMLLTSMAQVFWNQSKMLERHDGRMMLNSDLDQHLLGLRLAVSNTNIQIIVHLPALLPKLSSELSSLVRMTSELEEQVVLLQYLHTKIKANTKAYDPSEPNQSCIDPGVLYRGADGHLHLNDRAEKSDKHYLYLVLFEVSRRARNLYNAVDDVVERYHGGWKRLHGDERDKSTQEDGRVTARRLRDQVRNQVQIALALEESLERQGLFLVYFTPAASVDAAAPTTIQFVRIG
jgi:hypothetical protein